MRKNLADVDKVKVKLANGNTRTIQHTGASGFWSPDGNPISAAFGAPDTRRQLLEGLEKKSYGIE